MTAWHSQKPTFFTEKLNCDVKFACDLRGQLPWWISGKESACNEGDAGSIPGSGRSPGRRNGNPVQYSCWRIPWTEGPAGLQSVGSHGVGHGYQYEDQRVLEEGEGAFRVAHLLIHLFTEQVCTGRRQSTNPCLRCWTANVPEMGLLGSGRESRSKTRCSQMPEPVQAGEGEGPRSFFSSFSRERVTGHASVTSGQGQGPHGVPRKLCAHPNLWDL